MLSLPRPHQVTTCTLHATVTFKVTVSMGVCPKESASCSQGSLVMIFMSNQIPWLSLAAGFCWVLPIPLREAFVVHIEIRGMLL